MSDAGQSQTKYDVDFSVLGQTGLLPLWGRYWWHKNDAFDFEDPFALKIVEQTNYDFKNIDKVTTNCNNAIKSVASTLF